MYLGICNACTEGNHAEHTPVITAPAEGMMGGEGCKCKGECVDHRYAYVLSPDLLNLTESLRRRGC